MAMAERLGVSRKIIAARINTLKAKGVVQREGSDGKTPGESSPAETSGPPEPTLTPTEANPDHPVDAPLLPMWRHTVDRCTPYSAANAFTPSPARYRATISPARSGVRKV